MPPKATNRRPVLILLSLFVLLAILVVSASTQTMELGNGRMQDFSYYMTFISRFWFEGPRNFYAFSEQQKVVSEIFGFPSDTAMPLVWTPSAFVTFLPIASIFRVSSMGASILWLGASILVFLAGLWPYLKRHASSPRSALVAIGIACAVVISNVTLRTIALSQSSLFALGVFLILLECDFRNRPIVAAGLLLLLSLKPLYFVPASILLISRKNVRAVVLGIALSTAASIFVLTRMGMDSVSSYLETLRLFASSEIPIHYFYAFPFGEISTFSAVFSPICGATLAYSLSAMFLLVFVLGALLVACWGKERYRAFLLSLAAFLLFSPYLGVYEDILLCCVAMIFLASERGAKEKVLIVVLLLFVLNPVFGVSRMAIFLAKSTLFACTLLISDKRVSSV